MKYLAAINLEGNYFGIEFFADNDELALVKSRAILTDLIKNKNISGRDVNCICEILRKDNNKTWTVIHVGLKDFCTSC